jgi:DNA-binding beta-propeller fold protein YncE
MITVGSGKFTYKVVEGWGKLPESWKFTQIAGIIVDPDDRVFVYNRGEHHVIVFDRDGKLLYAWGEEIFASAHGLWLDDKGYLYFADHQNHTIKKCTVDGKLLMTLGTENVKGDAGQPFRSPTGVSVAPSGDIYVADGYDNTRIHKYSPEGKHILSWGEKGEGEGQFAVPHGIFVHKDGTVYVADRENHRIQLFTPDGEFITQWKSDFNMPCTLFIDKDDIVYVPELRHRVSILNIKGELLARWGGVESHEIGQFVAPHTAWTDSKGDLYIGEVLEGQRLQKFERII